MLHTTNAIAYWQRHQINDTVEECQLIALETHKQRDGISQMHVRKTSCTTAWETARGNQR